MYSRNQNTPHIKLSVAIADTNALPSAFVVFRGIEKSIKEAERLGYEGVELALKNSYEIDGDELSKWLKAADMQVSCISTGQVYAGSKLSFTEDNREKREEVKYVFKGFIDLAE